MLNIILIFKKLDCQQIKEKISTQTNFYYLNLYQLRKFSCDVVFLVFKKKL